MYVKEKKKKVTIHTGNKQYVRAQTVRLKTNKMLIE